jgi:hypothetical protein
VGYHTFCVVLDIIQEGLIRYIIYLLLLSEKGNKSISGNYNFYAACAFAATKEYDLVFERLNAAVEMIRDPKQLYHQLQTEKTFDGLRESPAFKKVLQRLEEK